MTKKLIGSAKVVNGKVERIWDIPEDVKRGERTVYVTYVGDDGYILKESWEKAFLKKPTTVLFTKPEQSVTGSDKIFIRVNVFESFTDLPVDEGMVQFQAKTVDDSIFLNVGRPVEVTNGWAEYYYTVPDLQQTNILLKALYLSTKSYAESVTENYGNLYVRGKVDLNIEPVRASNGDTVTINATVSNSNGSEDVNVGKVNIYLDDICIAETVDVAPLITFDYDIPDDLIYGNHELKIEYLENDEFDYSTATNILYVKTPVVLDNNPVYASQTIDDDGLIKQGIADLPFDIRDPDGNLVNEGIITFICGETERIITLPIENDEDRLYDIPLGVTGGTEIPFTLDYHGTDNYQNNRIQSRIIIRHRSFMNFVSRYDKQENIIHLNATVTDEDGNGIDGGSVTFEMEQNE